MGFSHTQLEIAEFNIFFNLLCTLIIALNFFKKLGCRTIKFIGYVSVFAHLFPVVSNLTDTLLLCSCPTSVLTARTITLHPKTLLISNPLPLIGSGTGYGQIKYLYPLIQFFDVFVPMFVGDSK